MAYPSTFDNLPAVARGQTFTSASENAQTDSINAIEAALGLNPQGSSATLGAAIAALLGTVALPVGSISMFAGPLGNIPTGYMLCNGQPLDHLAYGALYAVIGLNFGGSGGNFNLPDLRGRIPLNNGGGHAITDLPGGEETHQLGATEIPGHNHTFVGQWMDVLSTGANNLATGVNRNLTFVPSSTTGATGGLGGVTQRHNNIQPFLVLNYIIKVQ